MRASPLSDWRSSVRHTGAVYTPVEVATSIVERCCSLLGARNLKVLEPSVGDGAFLSALTSVKAGSKKITAIDIDDRVICELRHRYHNQSDEFDFIEGDFVRYATCFGSNVSDSKKFNLIVGNPPFIRQHNFSAEIKDSLEQFATAFDYPRQRLKNTWPAFLIASSKLVSDDGIVALVLPYELLTVDYGQKALNAIQTEFERVDILVSKQKAFREIDQDAIILIAQKKTSQNAGLFVTKVSNFKKLTDRGARKIKFQSGAQGGIELNSYLLPAKSVKMLKRTQLKTLPVSHYLTSAPGVVSAANDFFIRTKADIASLGLSEYAKPILKKGSFASWNPVFTTADFDALADQEPCFLLHFDGEKQDLSPAAAKYITQGEERQLDQRYKCRNRANWYQVPLVEPEQAFLFKRSHSHPRVLLNEAGARTTDTAYGLRLKEGYSARGFCFSFYTSMTLLFAEMNGRFYGGGVLELSPNEFRALPLIYHEPTDAEFQEFLDVHQSARGKIEPILDFGDKWLTSSGYVLSEDLVTTRSAWATIRSHRMRHGGRSATN